MNENLKGLKVKLLFGAIVNIIATAVICIIFWCFLKNPSQILGPYATTPEFLSMSAVLLPAFMMFCAIGLAINLVAVFFVLNRFERASQSMRSSNQWKTMLCAKSEHQLLSNSFGLLAAPSPASADTKTVPLENSERVVVLTKVEPFDLATILSQAIPKPQSKGSTIQAVVTVPFFLGEPQWEKVQVLCDPDGKTARLIKNEQGEMWGVLQTRSAPVSQMMVMAMRRSKLL